MFDWAAARDWLYGIMWATQVGAVVLYIRSRLAVAAAGQDLYEAHELLLKAHYVLLDLEGFNAKYLAQEIRDHLEDKWEDCGMTEQKFRKLARETRRRDE